MFIAAVVNVSQLMTSTLLLRLMMIMVFGASDLLVTFYTWQLLERDHYGSLFCRTWGEIAVDLILEET
jgi:hypothetical protein